MLPLRTDGVEFGHMGSAAIQQRTRELERQRLLERLLCRHQLTRRGDWTYKSSGDSACVADAEMMANPHSTFPQREADTLVYILEHEGQGIPIDAGSVSLIRSHSLSTFSPFVFYKQVHLCIIAFLHPRSSSLNRSTTVARLADFGILTAYLSHYAKNALPAGNKTPQPQPAKEKKN